jgi:ATP-dependent Clp protease ATP-binding subunit ClpA
MFERFTGSARTVVKQAVTESVAADVDRVSDVHLLLALLESQEPAVQAVFADLDVDAAALASRVRTAEQSPPGRAGLSDEDVAALAGLGIDADEVLARAEHELWATEAAEEGRGVHSRAPFWRRRSRGGATRFSDSAKQSLEQSLRQALELRHREIASDHLLLGLLAADDAAAAYLRKAGVGLPAARAAVARVRREAG